MKGGSTARTFGVSLQEMVGHITAIGVATRESGNVVGNSLKTIYSRLTTMQPAIDALASIGISIKDTNGNMKSATVILDEMAKKWNTLTSETQQNVAVAVAGRYQLSRLLALLNNYQMGLDATETALNSEGSAMRENAEYMKSLEARIERMKAAWQEMALTLGDAVITDTLINLMSLATVAGNSFSWLVDKVGALPVVLGALGTVLAMTNKNFRTLTVAVMTLGRGFQFLGVSATAAKVAIRGLLASTGVGLLFAGIGIALEKLINLFTDATQVSEATTESIEQNLKTIDSNANNIDRLVNKYEELLPKAKNNKEAQDELLKVMEQLKKISPELTAEFNKTGDAFSLNTDNARTYAQHLRELSAEQSKILREKLSLQLFDKNQELSDAKEALSKIEGEHKKALETLQKLYSEYGVSSGEEFAGAWQKAVEKGGIDGRNLSFDFFDFQAAKKKLESSGYEDKLNKVIQLEGDTNGLRERIEAIDDLSKKTEENNDNLKNNVEANGRVITFLGKTIALTNEYTNEINDNTEAFDENSQSIEKTNTLQTELINAYKETVSEVEFLDQVVEELDENNNVSIGTIEKLNEKYGDFIDVTGLSIDKIREFVVEQKNKTKEVITAEREETKKQILATGIRIAAMKSEIDSIRKLRQERTSSILTLANEKLLDGGLSETAVENISKKLSNYGLEDKKNALNEEIAKLNELKGQLALLNHAYDTVENETYKKSKKPKEKKSKSPYIDKELNLLPHFKQQIEDATSQLEILDEKIQDTKRQMDYANDEGDLFGKIQLEKDLNNLLDERKNKYHEIAQSLRSMRDNEIIPQFDLKFSNFRQGRGFEEISQVEIQQYLDSLETQINDLTNKIGHTEADSVKASLQKQLEALKGDKDLFSYYVGIIEETNKSIDDLSNKWHDDHKNKLNALKNVFSDTLNDIRNQTSKSLDGIDEKINESNRTLKQYDSTSNEYRDELEKQNELLKQKQQIVHAEAEALREQLRTQELTSDQIETLNNRIKELSNSWWSFHDAIEGNTFNILQSRVNEAAEAVNLLDFQLQLIKSRMDLMTEGTKEYSHELSKQVDLLNQMLEAEKNHEQAIREQMNAVDLTADEWNKYNSMLQQSVLNQAKYMKSMQDIAKNIARQVVDAYKKGQEALRDAELKGYDDVIKKEEERHNKRKKNIDDELKQYENAINEQLKMLDRANAEEDYQEELTKKQKEAQEIRSKINEIALDDSIEAQAKRKQLEEELAKKVEEIEKFKRDRSRTIRKESLQDLLEQKRQETEKTKETEDEKFNTEKENLERLKEERSKYWEDILNNDAIYLQMEADILAGHFDAVLSQMGSMRDSVSNITQDIGESVKNNLISNLNQAINMLQGLKNGNYTPPNFNNIGFTPPPVHNDTNPNQGGSRSDPELNQKRSEHERYIQNKRAWQQIYESTGRMDTPQQIQLNNQNEALRQRWGFPDYDYEDIVRGNILRFKIGGYTADSEGLAYLDKQELVLNKVDTSNMLKAVDITRNIASGALDKIRNFMSNLNSIKKAQDTPVVQSLNFEKMIHIDKIEKDVDVDEMINKLGRRFKQFGFVMKKF